MTWVSFRDRWATFGVVPAGLPSTVIRAPVGWLVTPISCEVPCMMVAQEESRARLAIAQSGRMGLQTVGNGPGVVPPRTASSGARENAWPRGAAQEGIGGALDVRRSGA